MSVGAAVAREVIQNVGDAENDVADSIVDVAAWALGAGTAGGVAYAVAWRLDR